MRMLRMLRGTSPDSSSSTSPKSSLRSLLCALLLLLVLPAHAGQSCTEKEATPEAVNRALELAQKVQAALEAGNARAAILGRVGSDVTAHGLRYTHAGLVYRDGADSPWTVLHKLNHCGKPDAALYEQGLANFFLDDPHEYRALLLLPTAAAQSRIAHAALDGASAQAVHQPRYSLIAYPYGLEYQNSNGWLLEFLAEALAPYPVMGRRAAQDYLKETAYQPHYVHVSPLERLGGSLFRPNVAFFDHPTGDRLRGRYAIVSVESIARWLGQRDEVESTQELALRGPAS